MIMLRIYRDTKKFYIKETVCLRILRMEKAINQKLNFGMKGLQKRHPTYFLKEIKS